MGEMGYLLQRRGTFYALVLDRYLYIRCSVLRGANMPKLCAPACAGRRYIAQRLASELTGKWAITSNGVLHTMIRPGLVCNFRVFMTRISKLTNGQVTSKRESSSTSS